MFKKRTKQPAQSLYQHNLRLIRWLEIFNSMFFIIPVWVSFELRFITLAQLAMIEGAIALTQLLLELPTGALADLLGRKKTIGMGFLISGIGYFLFTISTSFETFLFSSMFFGVGEALISGAKEALVFDTLKESKKEKTFPKLMSSLQIRFYWGMAISTLIGGLIYQINIYLPGLMTGFAFFVCSIIAFNFREPSIDSEKFTLKNYLLQTKQGVTELFANSRAKKISLFYILLAALSWPMVISMKNISMQAVGLTELQIGFILPIINLLNVYLFRLALNKKIFEDLKFTFIILAVTTTAGWLVLALSFNIVTVLSMILLLSFISSCRWNVIGKLTNLCYSSKNRATAISTLSMAISISYTIVMFCFGLFSNYSQEPLTWIFILLFVLAAFALIPLAINLRKNINLGKINFEPAAEPALEKGIARQTP